MFGLENNLRYYMWPEPVDMRKNIDGLFNTIISGSQYEVPNAVVLEAQTEGVLCESFSTEPGPGWDNYRDDFSF